MATQAYIFVLRRLNIIWTDLALIKLSNWSFLSWIDSRCWNLPGIVEICKPLVEMATRNRTLLFRNYRDALRDVRKPSSSSSEPSTSGHVGSGPVIELSNSPFMHQRGYARLSTDDTDIHREDAVTIGLPPAWVDISEEIATNIQRARSKISTLVKTYAKALMPTFGDTITDQHAIEELTQDITHLLKRSEQMLQQLSGHGRSEDASVQKNVQRSLATDLQSLSMEFRKQQKAYLQRLQQLQDGPDGVDIGIDLNGQKSRHDEDDFFDSGFSEQQLAKMKKSEALTAEREREILQIVGSVNELQKIMKDLSSLVIDQGTIMDRIDYNVQNVASSVEQGVKHLQKAERTQREGGMVMCATVLIFMCIFMIFVLIIKEIFA